MDSHFVELLRTHPRICARWTDADWAILACSFPDILASDFEEYTLRPPGARPIKKREAFEAASTSLAIEGTRAEIKEYLAVPRGIQRVINPTLIAARHLNADFFLELENSTCLSRMIDADSQILEKILANCATAIRQFDLQDANNLYDIYAAQVIAKIVFDRAPKNPSMKTRLAIIAARTGRPEITRLFTAYPRLDWESMLNAARSDDTIISILAGPMADQAYDHIMTRFEDKREKLMELLERISKYVQPEHPTLYLAARDAQIIKWLYLHDCPVSRAVLGHQLVGPILRDLMQSSE